jgi:hypothetical protein
MRLTGSTGRDPAVKETTTVRTPIKRHYGIALTVDQRTVNLLPESSWTHVRTLRSSWVTYGATVAGNLTVITPAALDGVRQTA